MIEEFPQTSKTDLIVYAYSNGKTQNIINDDLKTFTLSLNETLYKYSNPPCVVGFQGYYTILEQGLPLNVAQGFLSNDNQSMIMPISINITYTSKLSIQFAEWVSDRISDLTPSNATFSVQLAGLPAFIPRMQSYVELDLALTDGIGMPIAMAIFGYVVRSARFLILPILAMACSAASSFTLMYFIGQLVSISSFTPSLMMSITVAMSIDYHLFLLTRYREELLFQMMDTKGALQTTLETAGHTVIVSGLTLTGCFLGLMILPTSYTISSGIGLSVTIIITMLVNLSLTPALLMLFSQFFARAVGPTQCCGRQIDCCNDSQFQQQNPFDRLAAEEKSLITKSPYDENNNQTARQRTNPIARKEDFKRRSTDIDPSSAKDIRNSTNSTSTSTTNIQVPDSMLDSFGRVRQSPSTSAEAVEEQEEQKSLWYKLGNFLVSAKPWNLIVVLAVIGCVVPFGMYSYSFSTSSSIFLYMPRGDSMTNIFLQLCNSFGQGRIYPMKLLVVPPDDFFTQQNQTVISQSFFDKTNSVIQSLATLPNTNLTDIEGFTFADGLSVPYDLVEGCLEMQSNASLCLAIQYAVNEFVNPNRTSAWYLITLQFDPITPEGFAWLDSARTMLANFTSQTGWKYFISGVSSDINDSLKVLYARFPLMIGVTGGVVLLLVAIAFQSILIPLRSVFTIALTIAFVYGFANLIYIDGKMNWTGWSSIENTYGLCWL